MHKDICLNRRHAKEGKLYLESGGLRVLYVFPDLPSDQLIELSAVQRELDGEAGWDGQWDRVVVQPRKLSNGSSTR